jgi:hypothetical protein
MWFLAKIKGYALVAAGVITALGYAYLKGRTDGSLTKENERLTDYADTRKAIDQSKDDIGNVGGGREWLLKRRR